MTATNIQQRSQASRRAAAVRKQLAAARQAGGPDCPTRGTVKGDYTVRELLDRIRARGQSSEAQR